jgi:HNH endonuclease/AP2 domain
MAKRFLRPIRIEGNVAYVTLTKAYVAIIDAVDVHLVDGHNWCALVGKNTVYARRSSSRDADGKQQDVRMHRVIMSAPPEFQVDHFDGDGLNNRRSTNLRLATPSQNAHNQGIRRSNTSGTKGVTWHCRVGKWVAHITLHGKRKNLGYFTEQELAAAAYATASAEFHGEFGRTE